MSAGDPILIVGAGLAGLSARLHLGDRPCRLIEAEREVGGLCRSVRTNGFVFDYTGHLLHLRRPEIRELVFSLVGQDHFLEVDRRSSIRSHGTYTAYPFQVNTHGLPLPVVRECVMGFAQTLQKSARHLEDPSFAEWVLDTFGRGIADHFLFPYNEKLLCADLETVSADWVSWSIPKPSWADVISGALGTNRKSFGYNPQFLYPATGGIDELPKGFLRRIPAPELGLRLVSFDGARREALLSNGKRVRWSWMVSSIPLPRLLAAWSDAPAIAATAARALRHVSVLNLNLGFDAPSLRDEHWVYFPEPRFPFYRVGVYSNLCPASVPAGCSSYYVETSYRPDERIDLAERAAACVSSLYEVGLVPRSARLVETRPIEIPVAYVVHDRFRRDTLPAIHAALAEQAGILSVGRYGSWEYSAMEDAIAHGAAAANRILGTDDR